MTRRLTQAELARELNVSRQAIHKHVQAKTLEPGEDGRIDLEAARAALAQVVHPGSKTAQAVSGSGAVSAPDLTPPAAAAPAAEGASSTGETDENGLPTNFHVARTLNEIENLRINTIKRRQMEGDLIRLDAVRSVIANTLSATREALLQLPSRLAPVLAAETSAARVHDVVQQEIHQALGQLASLPERVGPEAQVEGQA